MEPTPEITEEIITETPIPKVKKERTSAQLENLAKAREKAAVVRAQNTEIRRKQAEIDKALALEVKKQKINRVEKEYAAIHGETSKTEKDEEEEEEIDQPPSSAPHVSRRSPPPGELWGEEGGRWRAALRAAGGWQGEA